MIRVKPHGPVVRGVDISHHNGVVHFDALKAAGVEYVYAKCSEYTVDGTYQRNKAAAKAAGLLFGAYDFFHPAKPPAAQAAFFLKNANLQLGDLVPWLDWESTDGVPSVVERVRAIQWLNIISAEMGGKKRPIIYGSPYFLQALDLDVISFKKYGLCTANYGVDAPLVPPPWDDWVMWQTSEHGHIPGVSGAEDTDLFNGTIDDLKAYTI